MMRAVLIMAVIFGCVILALAAVIGTIFVIIRILRGGVSREEQRILSEETRMIQDIYQGLRRMEERVEALETLLLDRERKDRET